MVVLSVSCMHGVQPLTQPGDDKTCAAPSTDCSFVRHTKRERFLFAREAKGPSTEETVVVCRKRPAAVDSLCATVTARDRVRRLGEGADGAYVVPRRRRTFTEMGELKLLPLASLTAGTVKPRRLHSPIVAVVEAAAEPTAALLVAAEAVTVRFVVHPSLVTWLTTVGWSADAPGPSGDVRLMRRRPSPQTLDDPALAPLLEALGPNAALAEGLLVGRRRHTTKLGAWSAVLAAGRLEVTPLVERLGYDDVARFVEESRAEGGLVCGATSWFELERLARSTVRVVPADGNPARAWTRLGTVLDVVERPAAAFARVEDLHLQVPVAIGAGVVDVAAMSVAVGTDRPGLLAEQDRLVSVLLASDTGAVLAPPPGSGKTVIVAAALAELAPASALIAAPVAVLDQWAAELATWAPDLSVGVARDIEQLRRLRNRRRILVASHQVVARATASWRTPIEVLVVDEAHALLRRSDTGTLLRAARRLAGRAWALTGSPDEASAQGNAASLVAWVRNLPSAAVEDAPAVTFEPILCGGDRGTGARLRLPELVVEPVRVEPTYGDLDALRELWAAGVPPRGLARRRALERLRTGLGDPVAVLGPAGRTGPSKRALMLARVAAHAAEGRSALVFSSSAVVLREFVEQLRASGVNAAILPGSDARTDRVRVLSAFDEGTIPVLAVPPSSQRGVNLQRADLVVHLDLPATNAEFVQRNGRAARIGSVHASVTVAVPYLAGTRDESWTTSLLRGDDGALDELAAPGEPAD